MSVHLIPQEAQQETYERMSPRYITTYKKTNEQIFKPNHETLNGLAVASEYVYDDPQELQATRVLRLKGLKSSQNARQQIIAIKQKTQIKQMNRKHKISATKTS